MAYNRKTNEQRDNYLENWITLKLITMSHNININRGKASFMSVKEKAWHGLGQVLDKPATSEKAIVAAGLDYQVGLCKVYANISLPKDDDRDLTVSSDVMRRLDRNYVTYRKDTNKVFAVVGSKYTVVQNKEAFRFFDSIVGEGSAIYETAGALGGGETIFITAKLPNYIRVGGSDDVIEKYLLLKMSHDGSSSIQAMFTPIRVVCNNTLNMALSRNDGIISIRHTKSVHDQLEVAHKTLGIVNKLSEELQERYTQMALTPMTDEQTQDFVQKLVMTNEEYAIRNITDARKELVSSRKENILGDIMTYIHSGKGGQDLATCKNTVFGAYNGITGYYNNVKQFKNAESRMSSAVLGTGYATSQKAFVLADSFMTMPEVLS